MLTPDGFCVDCRKWVHEHPDLTCPWCLTGKPSPEVMGATDPVGALIDIRVRGVELVQARTRQRNDRRALARHVLADPELVMEARRRGVRLTSLDRWATLPKRLACPRRHPGDLSDWDGSRWVCRECVAEGPAPARLRGLPAAERKKTATLAAAWRKHEAMLEERARLAALDQIPARLNPPMAPPTRVL